MNIRNSIGLLAIGLWLSGAVSCKQDLTDDAIPFIPFPDVIINLNLPEYSAIKIDGGVHLLNEGVRGILVYRQSSTSYLAYERNCSFSPNNACATIDVHASNLFMVDSCCGSSFNFDDGKPTGGPAWRPLRRYRVFLDGAQLTVTSESANGM